jgi:FlaG/FlaF family flagellin (archaellin)
MMRAGISRVVVEIIILVIAVALALLIFSPISGYIFGSLGRTSTVGGASQIQVLNAQRSDSGWTIDVKNLGPGTPDLSTGFKVYIDGTDCGTCTISGTSTGPWGVGTVVTITCGGCTSGDVGNTAKQHSIVVYGPGNTQSQYLYYPPS